MSNQDIEAKCFLCGHNAVYNETDYANRRFYQCTNPSCGEYEISRTAMHRLKNSNEFKEIAIRKANKCLDTNEILEIIVDKNNRITTTFKLRSSGPG